MKIIRMNIKGVGGNLKKKCLEELIKKKQEDVVCLQETKFKEMGKKCIFKMWRTNEIDWIKRGVKNNASGMITMWMRSCFHLANVITGENYCIIQGEWRLGEASRITNVNIYNFGSLIEKTAMWEEV